MMTWRIALPLLLVPATLGAFLTVGCNNDVDTPPWYPNYTASGYGGAKASGGTGGVAGASGAAGSAGTTSAGSGGSPVGEAGSSGEGGEAGAN